MIEMMEKCVIMLTVFVLGAIALYETLRCSALAQENRRLRERERVLMTELKAKADGEPVSREITLVFGVQQKDEEDGYDEHNDE